jgi:N-methylhydantoinase A
MRAIDIHTIGAGGGSIASIELGGVLKVGPRSAGARPGPACYQRGGSEPTLTDALVVLGNVNPNALLGGAMPIAREKARAAVTDRLAATLGMTAEEAAWGVLKVLATNCMTSMRTITIERGYDPREFTLVAFGGMGPTIAGFVAAELGIHRILVPRDPGAFSAWGMLVTDVQQERSLTRITPLDKVAPEALEGLFRDLETQSVGDLVRQKFPRERIGTLRAAGMRYRGQSYEVDVPVAAISRQKDIDVLIQAFHATHRRRYGHTAENEAVEIVNFRVTAVAEMAKPGLKRSSMRSPGPAKPRETRPAYFHREGFIDAPVFWRADLHAGTNLAGPAIIEEQTSTIVVGPDQSATIDEYLNVELII